VELQAERMMCEYSCKIEEKMAGANLMEPETYWKMPQRKQVDRYKKGMIVGK
jgi:hypothetical protein